MKLKFCWGYVESDGDLLNDYWEELKFFKKII